MADYLSPDNVIGHLIKRGLCRIVDRPLSIDSFSSKNINLLVTLASEGNESRKLRYLVKQGQCQEGELSDTGCQREWSLYEQIRCRQELRGLCPVFPDAADYDPCRGILVLRFLDQYLDLGKSYSKSHLFNTRLAVALGASLASVHQTCFACTDQSAPFEVAFGDQSQDINTAPDLCGEMEHLTPDIFRRVPRDGLKFYVLYQRAPEISDAIIELENSYQACCLIHHDLKFANILLHSQWPQWSPPNWPIQPVDLALTSGERIVRIIDWEQWRWGDPAFDLGSLVAEYLRLWLKSIPMSKDIDLKAALQLAEVPLKILQPSIKSLLQAYLGWFPAVRDRFPDFPVRVLRFAGLALFNAVQDQLHCKKSFGNLEITTMQVGRNLLCHPASMISTVYGCEEINSSKTFEQLTQDSVEPHTANVGLRMAPTISNSGEQVESPAIPISLWPPQGSWQVLLGELCANVRIEQEQIRHLAYAPQSLMHPARSLHLNQESGSQTCRATSEAEHLYLVRQIRNYLHAIYFSGVLNNRDHLPFPAEAFASRLEAANGGIGYYDPNWVVMAEEDGDLLVAKEGLHLWITPSRDLAISTHSPISDDSAHGAIPDVGATVTLRLPNATWMQDHYVAIGNAGEPETNAQMLEIFFNISADGAIILMERCIPMLNERLSPFLLKVLSEPHMYERFDSAILRISAATYGDVHSLLTAFYPELQPHLRSAIPLFTFPLAKGIGLAEVPENGTDFGLDRCELLAEAFLASLQNERSRRELIQLQFDKTALDLQRPHLNTASVGRYPTLGLKGSLSMSEHQCGS